MFSYSQRTVYKNINHWASVSWNSCTDWLGAVWSHRVGLEVKNDIKKLFFYFFFIYLLILFYLFLMNRVQLLSNILTRHQMNDLNWKWELLLVTGCKHVRSEVFTTEVISKSSGQTNLLAAQLVQNRMKIAIFVKVPNNCT